MLLFETVMLLTKGIYWVYVKKLTERERSHRQKLEYYKVLQEFPKITSWFLSSLFYKQNQIS